MTMTLDELTVTWGPKVVQNVGLDSIALLRAIAEVESSYGRQNLPRFEPAYSIGGYYYRRAPHVRAAWERWGDYAACSYSSWQILYIVAKELGYDDQPHLLRHDDIAIPWVVAMLNKRIFGRGATTLQQVGDGWNSGDFRDSNVPTEYIRRLEAAYMRHSLSGATV